MYTVYKITPITNIISRDLNNINIAANCARESRFDDSKRLGACIQMKGKDLLW